MARVYHPKSTSARVMDGVVAGLVGGVVAAVILFLLDGIFRGDFFFTPTVIGWLLTGDHDMTATSYILGVIVHFVLFALIGVGLVFYLPVFRRLNLNSILGGAIYGAIVGIAVFFVLLGLLNPAVVSAVDNKALLFASIVAGAAMGWWLARPAPVTTQPDATEQAVQEDQVVQE